MSGGIHNLYRGYNCMFAFTSNMMRIVSCFLLFLVADAAQDCTNGNHVSCIQANGNGWGCDSNGNAGDCCAGDCCSPDNCDAWCCQLAAVVADVAVPDGVCGELISIYDEYETTVQRRCVNGEFPGSINDFAWLNMVNMFTKALNKRRAETLFKPDLDKKSIPSNKIQCIKRDNAKKLVTLEFVRDNYRKECKILKAVVKMTYNKETGDLDEQKSSYGDDLYLRKRPGRIKY